MGDKWDKYKIRTMTPAGGEADPKQEVQETLSDAAVGVGTGASSDLDDEIAGALNLVGKAFTEPTKRPEQAYREGRDPYRERKRLAEKRSPTANTIGQVGGGLAQNAALSAVIPGAGAAKLVPQAAEAAVQAFGASETNDPAEIAKGTAAGVVGGQVTKKLVGGVGRNFSDYPKKAQRLKRAADKSEVSAAGIHPADAAALPGGVEAQASRQRKMNIGGTFANKDDIYEQAVEAQKRVDAGRKAIEQQLAQSGLTINGQQVALALRNRARIMAPTAQSHQIAQLEDLASKYEKRGSVSFADLNRERAAWGSQANFAADSPQALVKQDVHKALNDTLEQAANQASPGAGRAWRELGQMEHAAIMARDGADDRLSREASNRVLSPSDQGVAMIAGAKAGIPAAAASGLANRVFRGAERSAMAAGQRAGSQYYRTFSKPATTIGKVLERSAPKAGSAVGRLVAGSQAEEGVEKVQAAAQISEDAAAQAHYLESMTNPEYRDEAMK